MKENNLINNINNKETEEMTFTDDELLLKIDIVEEYTYLSLLKNNQEVGKISLTESYIDYFINDELDFLLTDFDLEHFEESLLIDLKEEMNDKSFVMKLDYFNIKEEYREEGYGNILFNETMKYISREFDNSSSLFLNASPEHNSISLDILVEFYKKFGFEEILYQGTNSNMIVRDISDIKILQDLNKKVTIQNDNNSYKLSK